MDGDVTEDFQKVDAIANVMADMEMSPTGSELMEEQLDKINRLGEEISVTAVKFLPVDE